MNTSLAAFFYGPGRKFQLRKVPLPALEHGEILARILCCTICGSDLHTFAGRRKVPTPCILGHEILAEIHEVRGHKVLDLRGAPLRVGDRIVWGVVRTCQRCRLCRQGLPQKCCHGRKFGHQVDNVRWQLCGGLAEFCHLPSDTSIVKVDATLPDQVLCPSGCATATVAAALREAGPLAGRRILILGAGLLGLTAAAMAATESPASITVCDPDQERLDWAPRFGASLTVAWSDIRQATAKDSSAYEFDVIFEMSGQPEAVETGLSAASVGARILLVGSVLPSRDTLFNPETVVRRCLRIAGVHNYAPADLTTAIRFLEQMGQTRPFAELVAASFRLTDVEAAFRYASSERAVRVAVRPAADFSGAGWTRGSCQRNDA